MTVFRATAGGVVVGVNGKVVVVDQNGDSWSLPKGGVEDDETVRQAAIREIAEESGVTELEYVADLGEYKRPKIGKHGRGSDPSEIKLVTMFLFTTSQLELHPTDPVNTKAVWADVDDVSAMLTHEKDKEFFESIKHEIVNLLRARA